MEYISHCIKNSRWKLQGRSAAGALLILTALSLLGWIYLTQASHVATTGRRVQKLESEKKRIEQENFQLMAEIAELESVSRLATRARELGFAAYPVQDALFVVMNESPPAYAQEGEGNPPVARWLDDVAAQFTAWAGVGSQ